MSVIELILPIMSSMTLLRRNMDLNFYNTIEELNKNKVSYLVCHGSLLGLARNGDLIPWDHDIDIAVWEGEYTEEYIINIF